MRRGRRHHEPNYGAVSACIRGTAPAGGWIRRRRRRATGRRRAGKRRIELSLNTRIFFWQISSASCEEHLVFGDAGEEQSTEIECQREHVRRIGPGELRRWGGRGEPQPEDGTRRPTTRTHTIIMRAAIVFFPVFFYEAVVQHVTYVTDFCRVGRRVEYPSWGTTPRNVQFSGAGVVAALQPVR